MKTYSYIYGFSVINDPDLNEDYTFQCSLDIIGSDQIKSYQILNCIIEDAIKNFKNRTGEVITKNEIMIDFVALVNTSDRRKSFIQWLKTKLL